MPIFLSSLPIAKKAHSIQRFLKGSEKNPLSLVKLAANYAKINRVDNLDAGFQQVPLV